MATRRGTRSTPRRGPWGDPRRRKYPLATRREVHAAIAHFAANRGAYPSAERAAIGARIKRRAEALGIRVRAF
jgi:hypothetical protein